MRELITNPEKFAELFNREVPDAYRKMTVEEIRILTEYGLIRRYSGYYSRDDIWRIIGILRHEQWVREHIYNQVMVQPIAEPTCKLCGKTLPARPQGMYGRPRRYCSECQLKRNVERGRKYRAKLKLERVSTVSQHMPESSCEDHSMVERVLVAN